MWKAIKGATVLVPSGPAHDPDRLHLQLILTDPIAATGEILMTSLCKIPASNIYDGSCSLFPGEHSFVTLHSYVSYRHCKIVQALMLEAKVSAHEFYAKEELGPKRLGDVLVGFKDSPHVAPKYRRFFDAAT